MNASARSSAPTASGAVQSCTTSTADGSDALPSRSIATSSIRFSASGRSATSSANAPSVSAARAVAVPAPPVASTSASGSAVPDSATRAAHTGDDAIMAAGHQTGEGYSVQANLMEHASVWPAMARAFESTEGDLAARMLAALEAAQAEGGDIRGRQSAALLVVSGEPTGRPWLDRIYDLRIEDHPEPLVELRRLLHLARAYREMNAGDEAMTTSDVEAAVAHYNRAAEMVPESAEMVYWAGVSLAGAGRVEESLARFERAFAADPRWAVLTPRLPLSGLLPDDPDLLHRILAVPGGVPGMEEWRRLAGEGLVPAP